MTNPEKKKAVLYAREVPDPERFVYILDKWSGLRVGVVLFRAIADILMGTVT